MTSLTFDLTVITVIIRPNPVFRTQLAEDDVCFYPVPCPVQSPLVSVVMFEIILCVLRFGEQLAEDDVVL